MCVEPLKCDFYAFSLGVSISISYEYVLCSDEHDLLTKPKYSVRTKNKEN